MMAMRYPIRQDGFHIHLNYQRSEAAKPGTGRLCLPPARAHVPSDQSVFFQYWDMISRQNSCTWNRKDMPIVCFMSLGSTNMGMIYRFIVEPFYSSMFIVCHREIKHCFVRENHFIHRCANLCTFNKASCEKPFALVLWGKKLNN